MSVHPLCDDTQTVLHKTGRRRIKIQIVGSSCHWPTVPCMYLTCSRKTLYLDDIFEAKNNKVRRSVQVHTIVEVADRLKYINLYIGVSKERT